MKIDVNDVESIRWRPDDQGGGTLQLGVYTEDGLKDLKTSHASFADLPEGFQQIIEKHGDPQQPFTWRSRPLTCR